MTYRTLLAVKYLCYGLRLLWWVGASFIALFAQTGEGETAPQPDDRRLDALADIGQAILSVQLKLDALCELVYEQASKIIDTTNFQVGLFDEDDYIIMVWMRNGERLPVQRFHGAANEGLIGWIRKHGQSLLVGSYQAEWDKLPAKPRYSPDRPIRPAKSGLFAPLVASGETVGVIVVQSDTPYAFQETDLDLLSVLTNQAAGAIHNAQLFNQTQARNRQMRLVSEVSHQITAVQPLPDLFHQIVTLIQGTFLYYAVSVYTIDERQKALRLGASSHPELQERARSLVTGTGLVRWAAETGQSGLALDVSEDDRYSPDMGFEETRAEVAVPLIVEGRVLGVLDVQSDLVNAFSRDDITILEALAAQLALAIQESENYDAERRQRERLNTLAEASRAVVSVLNIDELLDEVVDLVTDYFGYDRTHIFLREGEQIVFRAGSGVHSGLWAIEGLAYGLNEPGFIPEAARTGKPVISNNVLEDPHYIAGPGVEDTKAEVAVPIHIGRRILGVLDIQSLEANAFAPEDVEMTQALADTVAIALRNANLYAREKRRRILAETLREVSAVLGASLEVDSVLNGILHGLERVVTVNGAVILLFDDDEETYRISAVRGGVDESMLGVLLPPEADVAGQLTAMFHPSQPEVAAQEHDHLFIPLVLGDEPIGYLGVDHQGTGRFSIDDIEIINAFATQSAIAIANAQLYMGQREEAWISTALLQVAEATARASTLDKVLSTVARITPLLVGVEWCAILLIEAGNFRIVEVEGTDPTIVEALVGITVNFAEWAPLAEMLESREAVTLDKQTVPVPGILDAPEIEKGVVLPLYVRGEIVGALVIGQQSNVDLLSTRKIELIGGIANQAALAIETAQLYAAQQEEAWVTTALLQVAESVNAQVELSRTLETIVRLTPMLVGVLRCGVMYWNLDQQCFLGGISYGLSPEFEEGFAGLRILASEHPYLALLSLSTSPIACGEGTGRDLPAPLARLFESQALLGLPLVAQGQVNGIMLVDYPRPGEDFDQRQMNILTGIASQTAMALETSRLQDAVAERRQLERELELAQDIQHSFLPESAPSITGWDVASFYRSARLVGGDFYDFIPRPDGTWGLVVADVADKGVAAALYMALSRTLIRAVGRNHEDTAETLLRVNKLLLTDSRSDLFVTVWYGIWNPAQGTLRYTCAGHNPPFILRADGTTIETLQLKGIALGVIEDIALQTEQIRLNPGDVLVMYTDGVTEARAPDGTEFGVKRLEETTRLSRNDPASAISAAIVASLEQHSQDEPQFDDLTLVIICSDKNINSGRSDQPD